MDARARLAAGQARPPHPRPAQMNVEYPGDGDLHITTAPMRRRSCSSSKPARPSDCSATPDPQWCQRGVGHRVEDASEARRRAAPSRRTPSRVRSSGSSAGARQRCGPRTLRTRSRTSKHIEEFLYASLRIAMDLGASESKGCDLPGGEPAVAFCVAPPLFLCLVVIMAIEFDRHRGAIVVEQEVEPVATIRRLHPRLHRKQQPCLAQCV